MKNPEVSLLERVSGEATKSILADNGGMAPFDVPALIVRPKFEHNPYADESLRIIGGAVRVALATVLRDSTAVPSHLDRFFALACRSVFDQLKMSPVLNYTLDDHKPCDRDSGHYIEGGFETLSDLGVTTEIGVPINRLIPFLPEVDGEKVYPKVLWMRQLRELQESLPDDHESHQLRSLLSSIIDAFIDFSHHVLQLGKRNDLDDSELRSTMTALRLGFITKISRFHHDIRFGEFFDPDSEHTVMLWYIQTRLGEILLETKNHIASDQ